MIALDIDGVCADSVSVLRSVIRYSYGVDILKYLNSYNFPQIYPNFDIAKFFEQCIINFDEAVQPYPTVVEAVLFLLQSSFHPIIFITARCHNLKDITKNWIVKKLCLPKECFSVILKPSAEKKNYIRLSGITHFVEDRLKTANEIAEISSVKKSYLINRQWNIGRPTHNKVIRKDNLLQCVEDYLKEQKCIQRH